MESCQILFQDERGVKTQVYVHNGCPERIIADLFKLKSILTETKTYRGAKFLASQFIFISKLLKATDNYKSIDDILSCKDNQPAFLLEHMVEECGKIHGDEAFLYFVKISRDRNWVVKIATDFPEQNAWKNAKWMFNGTLEQAFIKYVLGG